ncbi:MAG TPA: M90 family metallopeptidase [Methylibium sp.]
MIGSWWRRRREARVLAQRAIPEPLWQTTLALYPFLQLADPAEQQELRRLTSLFLAQKEFTGAGGLIVTDAMAVAVAAQACLPILHLGLSSYAGFVGIVIHPDEVVAKRETMDEAGVVHHYDEVLAGEAMEGGPVMLSWRDVAGAGESAAQGYNVVIHEFVHVLDMADGRPPDGIPPLASRAAREHWAMVLAAEYERFCHAVDAGYETFLDPYGTTGPEEFFSVAAEAFFVAPAELQQEHRYMYELMAHYFKQDPAQRAAQKERGA